MVSVTSARPRAGRAAGPAKTTSSILPPRRLLAPCSPSTQAMASTTLDLPEPLGPTTAVIPGSSRSVVGDAKDLKPLSVRLDRCTTDRLPDGYDIPAQGRTGQPILTDDMPITPRSTNGRGGCDRWGGRSGPSRAPPRAGDVLERPSCGAPPRACEWWGQ